MKKFKDFKLNENSSDTIYVVFKIMNGWETSISSFWLKHDAEKYYINWVNNYYKTNYDNFEDAEIHHEENYDGQQIYLEKSTMTSNDGPDSIYTTLKPQ